jgi:serine protease AprX
LLKLGHLLLVVIAVFSIILAGSAAPASAAPWQSKVDSWVLQTASEGETEFLVYLSTQADLSGARALTTKHQKGWYVYRALTTVADRAQKPIITELEKLGVDYRTYWIADMVWVRGNKEIVQMLAQRSDVAHLYANPHVALEAPVEELSSNAQPQAVEWNISQVKAPEVWALGYTGQGVVIGGQDTGYKWDHPALKNQYRGWDGAAVEHDYNWFDATASQSSVPVDPYGHGTHTMGTMVGDDGGDNQIGMAPGARWIGCRNMDASGHGTPETYIGCYQWFLAPTRVDGTAPRPDLAPDVINNSWSCPPGEGCTDPDVLLEVVQSVVAAGIVTAHSAGNSGSSCGTIQNPAAIYAESFTVGGTDSGDTIANFSSRGPVTVDGSNRPKPNISAPGVGVRSCIPGGGYASMSGTSMAAPHVAGLVALLISAQPALRGQVDQIESLIEQTALHIPSTECSSSGVPNNLYGWGRIDALAAVESVDQLELEKNASATMVSTGDLVTYTLTITHASGITATTNIVLTDTIPVGSTFISATSTYTQTVDSIHWDFPSLDPLAMVSVQLVVRVNLDSTGTLTNQDYAVQSDQVALVRGEPLNTLVGRFYFLPVVVKNP